MKKIQSKIAVIIVLSTFVAAIINTAVGAGVTRVSTVTAIENTLLEAAEITALASQNTIATYTYTISEIASNSILTDADTSREEKQDFIDAKVAAYYMQHGGLTDTVGIDRYFDVDLSQEPFFLKAMEGHTYMSTPYVTEDNNCYLVVSAPVYSNDAIIGVVYFCCDISLLQSLVSDLKIGESGDAYILDKDGNIIASKDLVAVFAKKNLIADAAATPGNKDLQSVANIHAKMIAGETGLGSYSYNNGSKYIQSYTPIPSSDGWSIAVIVDQNEFMRAAFLGNIIQLVILTVIITLSLFVAFAIGRSIANPIIKCTNRLKLLAKGDLHSPMPVIKSQDEVKMLAESMAALCENFRVIISEVGKTLEKISEGDLVRKDSGVTYPGDFAVLPDYIETIYDKLNITMAGIISAADQVSSGADQVASTGAILASGSNEQANAIELLSGEIGGLSSQISNASQDAENAKEVSAAASAQLMNGVETMKALISSVHEIEDKSNEISKIIVAIEDIASQTNILALNASIEAARAGMSGKGFAVIADNVRELATKSAEATQSTTALIKEAINATHRGSELARVTSEELQQVISSSNESVRHIHLITDEVHKQADAVSMITKRVDEIASVVESNTATSEESAATAEELSSQADIMKELVSRFRLDNR